MKKFCYHLTDAYHTHEGVVIQTKSEAIIFEDIPKEVLNEVCEEAAKVWEERLERELVARGYLKEEKEDQNGDTRNSEDNT